MSTLTPYSFCETTSGACIFKVEMLEYYGSKKLAPTIQKGVPTRVALLFLSVVSFAE